MTGKFITTHIENRSPSCILLDEIRGSVIDTGDASLFITVNFNEESLRTSLGMVRYAVNRAELKFELIKCHMPMKNRKLVCEFSKEIVFEKQVSFKDSNKEGRLSELTGGLEASENAFGLKTSKKASSQHSTGSEREVVTKFTMNQSNVSSSGPNDRPSWHFVAPLDSTFLKGCLLDQELGSLVIEDSSAIVTASVVAAPCDIVINEFEGLWPIRNKNNKKALAKLLLWHFVLKDRFDPSVSELEIQFERYEQ